MNIGVHFFDLLLWLFGPVVETRVHLANSHRMAGFLELERARVRWFLSVDPTDLPFHVKPGDKSTYRSIVIDGSEVEFTDGFTDMHTKIYGEVLEGRGVGIKEVRPSIELVHLLRTKPISSSGVETHPFLK